MIKIYHIADLHLGLRFQNHPEARETLVQAHYETLEKLVGMANDKDAEIRAMKFFKGQENARVYCKEVTTRGKITVIIAAEVLERKKQTKLTHKEINSIHPG